jgi:hypothetical protein
MAIPTADATIKVVTTINETGKGSGIVEALSCAAPAHAVTTAAAIPLNQDVDQAEYIEEPLTG